MKTRLILMLLAGLFLFATASLTADEMKTHKPKMSPKEEAAMKAWQAYATPGKPHQNLRVYVGNWNATMKMWMKPGAEPTVSKGTATCSMILGGRYLQMNYKSTFEGQPFEGVGIMGYDNHTKEYRMFWIDNMSTGFFTNRGTCDAAFHVCTSSGMGYDPMSGGDIKTKTVTTFLNRDTIKDEMFMLYDGKTPVKTMEILYKRK